MKLDRKVALVCAGVLAISTLQADETMKQMAGVWQAECFEMPNGKFGTRTVTVQESGDVSGDMVIFGDDKCQHQVKKIHKEYKMSMGKLGTGDDNKPAYEIKKVGKGGWVVYTMIRVSSPTLIIPADKTKARDGSTIELRANHFSAKSDKCKKIK